MILKQSKFIDTNHPDLMKLRRGVVEKSLWVSVLFCIILIVLLTAAVFYYKFQVKTIPSDTAFSKIGGKYLASTFASKMNFSVNPCDDFYEYSCGRFMKTTIIPEDAGSVNTINIIEANVLKQLHTLLNGEIRPNEIKPFKMAKQFYRQCMDTAQIEKNGLEFVIKKLNLTKTWPVLLQDMRDYDVEQWNSTEYHRYTVDFFIDTDVKNISRRVLYVSGPNLALSRDMLSRGFQDSNVRAYHEYMVSVATYFGANKTQADEEFAQVLLYEMLLANITIPTEERRDSNKLYNPTTIGELMKKYPFIDWLPYINSKVYGITFNEEDRVIVQQPTYFDNLEEILKIINKRTIANYIMWRELADYIPFLTSDLLDRAFEFVKSFSGRVTRQPRWSDCVRGVSGMLSVAVSSMYVREYFSDERIKHDIGQIVTEITSEFEKLLIANDWMDKSTKEEAIRKLHAMNSNIAYPSELMNDTIIEDYYKDLELNATNYMQSAINIDLHGKKFVCLRYHQPASRNDWIDQSTSTFVNANYNGKTNSIQIVAAMLQGHFFSPDRPLYMNYAAIGYVIGHEIIHGFDDVGRLYDDIGNIKDWWRPETAVAFTEKKKCIIEQFSNYRDKNTNLTLNGVNGQGENIADTAGLKLAYRAYKAAVKKLQINDPTLPGLPFTPEQLFWLTSAQTWCSIERDEVKKVLILTDNHALSQFRVIGPLSNSEEFSQDFGCAVGSPMNPKQKCEVW